MTTSQETREIQSAIDREREREGQFVEDERREGKSATARGANILHAAVDAENRHFQSALHDDPLEQSAHARLVNERQMRIDAEASMEQSMIDRTANEKQAEIRAHAAQLESAYMRSHAAERPRQRSSSVSHSHSPPGSPGRRAGGGGASASPSKPSAKGHTSQGPGHHVAGGRPASPHK